MSITTDFLLLYQELRVTPECSIEHFRRAYRRRVSELHPDRKPESAAPKALERLQTLTRLHDAAVQFHSRFGRLPGAYQQAGEAVGSAPRPARTSPAQPAAVISRRMLIFAGGAAAIALIWMLAPSDQALSGTDEPASESTVTAIEADTSVPAHAPGLVLGMTQSRVREIQGEPTVAATDRWEYGPSYVRFEHQKIVAWYSSPLYPLKISVQRPPVSREPN
jgi:hypothetical protein